MDGHDLLRRLRQLLNEDSDSGWLDKRTSYDYLYEAAIEFVDRTNCLRTTQSITTVADQANYNLNGNFLKLYVTDNDNDYFIRYNDGSNNYNIGYKDYNEVFWEGNTSEHSQSIPSYFSIIDDTPKLDQVTGTVSSTGAATYGESTLTDSAADFSYVQAGDIVHNWSDSSHGIVLSVTSTTALVTALFGGANNDWTGSGGGDTYVIQPQGRLELILDPMPSTASHTITFPYVQRPDPVYADHRIYRFPPQYAQALAKYAYWLYKYRDKEPDLADAMYMYWDRQVRRYASTVNKALRTGKKLSVNLRKRN